MTTPAPALAPPPIATARPVATALPVATPRPLATALAPGASPAPMLRAVPGNHDSAVCGHRGSKGDVHDGIRVLLADSQMLARAALRAVLAGQPDLHVVAEAADGAEAVRLTALHRPDVVLMDVRLPVLDGLAATRQIMSAATHPVQVVMVTSADADKDVYGAFAAGAGGFMLKNAEPPQLIDAVRAVAAGEASLSPPIARRLIDNLPTHMPVGAAELSVLTVREIDVLGLVAGGLTNEEIADRLVISHSTVKTHVSRILTKLGLRDRAQLVRLAYETGLIRPAAARLTDR